MVAKCFAQVLGLDRGGSGGLVREAVRAEGSGEKGLGHLVPNALLESRLPGWVQDAMHGCLSCMRHAQGVAGVLGRVTFMAKGVWPRGATGLFMVVRVVPMTCQRFCPEFDIVELCVHLEMTSSRRDSWR